MKIKKEPISKEELMSEKKATKTAFILMFPALILAGMAVFYSPLYGSLLAIALTIYQFIMLKQFIEDYMRHRI